MIVQKSYNEEKSTMTEVVLEFEWIGMFESEKLINIPFFFWNYILGKIFISLKVIMSKIFIIAQKNTILIRDLYLFILIFLSINISYSSMWG